MQKENENRKKHYDSKNDRKYDNKNHLKIIPTFIIIILIIMFFYFFLSFNIPSKYYVSVYMWVARL